MCYGSPSKSLQIARERMTAEQWTRFEREFDDFCVVQGLPDKWAYWPTYDWAKWAYFQGRQHGAREVAPEVMQTVAIQSPDLLPCPFCGEDAEHIHIYAFENIVRCTNECCLVRPSVACELPEECAAMWNRRHDKYEALEREHLGDAEKRTGIYSDQLVADANYERIAIAMMTDEQAEASIDRWRTLKTLVDPSWFNDK
jgi:hypothetical protein